MFFFAKDVHFDAMCSRQRLSNEERGVVIIGRFNDSVSDTTCRTYVFASRAKTRVVSEMVRS